jgi:sigma-E factor negative regulatory protein RseB
MRQWLTALISVWFASHLSAAPTPLTRAQHPAIWLTHATQAARDLSYQGIFLHQYGKHTVNYQLTHVKAGNDELELREVLDEPVRKYYRVNNTVTVLWAGKHAVTLDRRDALKLFPDQLFSGVNDIVANYTLTFGNKGQVAGLEAQALIVTPKDEYRYPHQFWIHPKSGLLLKSVVLNKDNFPIEVFSFLSLTLPFSGDKKKLMPPQLMAVPTPFVSDTQGVSPSVKKLPDGFKLVRQRIRKVGEKNQARHYLYSDGLVAVSVFVEPTNVELKKGFSTHDGTCAYSKQVGTQHITVIGDVPCRTVETFAHAFAF